MSDRRFWPRLFAMVAGTVLASCGGSSDDDGQPAGDCSVPAQNLAVHQIMQDIYLWNDQLPDLDPVMFDSPEALLEALRYEPLDRFSFIGSAAEDSAFLGAGQFIGFGFRSIARDGVQVVSEVFEGSPAEEAGLRRGSRIRAVDGTPIAEILAGDGFSASLGPDEVGHELSLRFENPGEGEREETLAKAVVTIPPVSGAKVLEDTSVPTGYLVFRNFVEPGAAALTSAFEEFRVAGVRHLIVDLRYNTGGLISVLEHFADLLAGRVAPAQEFLRYEYNDENAARDRAFLLESQEASLDLERIAFITTPSTASASEMLINGLDPLVISATVGDRTFGKPVGQLGYVFCEKILRPVSFRTVNGLGVGDFFDGIAADCPAGDELDAALGSPEEDSFAAAAFWLQNGFCPDAAAQPQVSRAAARPEARRWQALIAD